MMDLCFRHCAALVFLSTLSTTVAAQSATPPRDPDCVRVLAQAPPRFDAVAHYNAATCYAARGETALAVAHSLRALEIDPGMEAARDNLLFVRRDHGLPLEDPPLAGPLDLIAATPRLAFGALAVAGALALAALARRGRGGWAPRAVALSAFAAGAALYARAWLADSSLRVVARPAALSAGAAGAGPRAGPSTEAAEARALSTLVPGTVVRVIGRRGGRVHVLAPAGEAGWLAATDLIGPGPARGPAPTRKFHLSP